MERRVYHVQPQGSMWEVKYQEGAALSQHDTKETAVEDGRQVAHANRPSQLVIHEGDGSIETDATYQGNSSPPPG